MSAPGSAFACMIAARSVHDSSAASQIPLARSTSTRSSVLLTVNVTAMAGPARPSIAIIPMATAPARASRDPLDGLPSRFPSLGKYEDSAGFTSVPAYESAWTASRIWVSASCSSGVCSRSAAAS